MPTSLLSSFLIRAFIALLPTLAVSNLLAQSQDIIVRMTERSATQSSEIFGPDSREHADALDRLAKVYESRGLIDESRQTRERSRVIKTKLEAVSREKIRQLRRELADRQLRYMPSDPEILDTLGRLAALHYDMADWDGSYDYASQAITLVNQRIRRAALPINDRRGTTRADAEDDPTRELDDHLRFFRRIILAGWMLANERPEKMPEILDTAFQSAQLVEQTSTGLAAAKMSARLASGDPKLAEMIRKRASLSKQYYAAFAASTRQQTAVTEKNVETIEKQLAALDAVIAERFPDYYQLAIPKAYSIRETQAALDANEALLFVFETYELAGLPEMRSSFGHGRLAADTIAETTALQISLDSNKPTEKEFAWLVTKTDAKWVRIERDRLGISGKIINLRCGLDASNWEDPKEWPDVDDQAKLRKKRQTTIWERCNHYYGTAHQSGKASGGLPFDTHLANEIYEAIFGQFQTTVADKHIVAIATRPIASLPLQVLVIAKSETAIPRTYEDYRKVRWLGMRQPITVLPSVASLNVRNLSRPEKSGPIKKPYLGIGNPLLEGKSAQSARAIESKRKQKCGALVGGNSTGQLGTTEVGRNANSSFTASGLANVKLLRLNDPLPETADEICAVARGMGALEADVLLGSGASERALKSLDKTRKLEGYRVLHFATHAFMVNETEKMANAVAEPALILTPPANASSEDDGLLTASEIAQFRLDADWVVLSGCNTAAREQYSGDAFSGLARAFISAGAKSLVVSHWHVDSYAAQMLIIKIFEMLKNDSKLNRAVALRGAMQHLIMNDEPIAAHPKIWAPFVVVGVSSPTNY